MWRLMLEFPFFNTIFQDSSRILSGLFRDYSGISSWVAISTIVYLVFSAKLTKLISFSFYTTGKN